MQGQNEGRQNFPFISIAFRPQNLVTYKHENNFLTTLVQLRKLVEP